jgi:hypothetical protein
MISLQRIMDSLHKTSEEYGMKINLKKTKVMRISRNELRKKDHNQNRWRETNKLNSSTIWEIKKQQRDKETYKTRKKSLQQEQRAPAWKTRTQSKEEAGKDPHMDWSIIRIRDVDNAERRYQTTGII